MSKQLRMKIYHLLGNANENVSGQEAEAPCSSHSIPESDNLEALEPEGSRSSAGTTNESCNNNPNFAEHQQAALPVVNKPAADFAAPLSLHLSQITIQIDDTSLTPLTLDTAQPFPQSHTTTSMPSLHL